jgi:hypothetical protein
MLVVTFLSGTGSVRRIESVDCVRLVGNAVQVGGPVEFGGHCRTVASYAAGLWFFDNGHETFDRLRVQNALEILFESPVENRSGYPRQVDRIEVADAEIRAGTGEMIARLDDLLQNWYLSGSNQPWPVVVLQALN